MAKGGFRGMPGGMNQAAMMKQAQKMQQEMLRMQAEQEAKTFTAKAGGGMVSATVNGKQTGHQGTQDTAYTVYGTCTNGVVDMQFGVDELNREYQYDTSYQTDDGCTER